MDNQTVETPKVEEITAQIDQLKLAESEKKAVVSACNVLEKEVDENDINQLKATIEADGWKVEIGETYDRNNDARFSRAEKLITIHPRLIDKRMIVWEMTHEYLWGNLYYQAKGNSSESFEFFDEGMDDRLKADRILAGFVGEPSLISSCEGKIKRLTGFGSGSGTTRRASILAFLNSL